MATRKPSTGVNNRHLFPPLSRRFTQRTSVYIPIPLRKLRLPSLIVSIASSAARWEGLPPRSNNPPPLSDFPRRIVFRTLLGTPYV